MANTEHSAAPQNQGGNFEALLSGHGNRPAALLPALEQAQKQYGYLSKDTLFAIAKGLGIPLAEVAETASFYSLLSMEKLGKNIIHICDSAACHMDGGPGLRESLERKLGIHLGETTPDGKFTLLSCGCLGACGSAPAIMINGRVYGPVTAENAEQLLSELDSGVME